MHNLRKIYFLILFSFFCSDFAFSQNWESLGFNLPLYEIYSTYLDEADSILYMGGTFKYLNGVEVNGIGYWDGNTIQPMGSGIQVCNNFNCPAIQSMTKFNNKLFVHIPNEFVDSMQVNTLGIWDGSVWQSAEESIPEGTAYEMQVYNDELYVMGVWEWEFNQDTLVGIVKWDGNDWVSVNFPYYQSSDPYGFIYCSEVFEGNLYVAGNFRNDDWSVQDMARFDGTNWHPVGGGIKGGWDDVYDIEVFNGEIYIAGDFKTSSGNPGNKIMKLVDDEWKDVGGGIAGENDVVSQMMIYQEKLYVFGSFDYVGDGLRADNIAVWDGEKWCSLGSEFDNSIRGAFLDENNDLNIYGGFKTIDGDSIGKIAKWTGDDYVENCGDIVKLDILNKEHKGLRVSLSPNPTSNILNIHIENELLGGYINLNIVDFLGRTIHEKQFFPLEKQFEYQFNFGSYPVDTYFLKLYSSDRVLTKKIIVHK